MLAPLAVTLLADGEVSHDTIYTTMIGIMITGFTALFGCFGWFANRLRGNQTELRSAHTRTRDEVALLRGMINGDLTGRMEAQRNAVEAAIEANEEVFALKARLGEDIAKESYTAQQALQIQAEKLDTLIMERHRAVTSAHQIGSRA